MKQPEPVDVTTSDDGLPLTWLRQRRRYRVLAISEHWRIVDEWWADEVRRDYFRVETDGGHVFDIYHDMVSDRWFLSGMR